MAIPVRQQIQRTKQMIANKGGAATPNLTKRLEEQQAAMAANRANAANTQMDRRVANTQQQIARTQQQITNRGANAQTPNLTNRLNQQQTQLANQQAAQQGGYANVKAYNKAGAPGTKVDPGVSIPGGETPTIENPSQIDQGGIVPPNIDQRRIRPPTTPPPGTSSTSPDVSLFGNVPKDQNPGAPGYQGVPYEEAQNAYLNQIKNYQGDPLFNYQRQRGLQDLEKLYAARGLTKSGAEVQGNTDFLAQLSGQENQRAQDLGQQEANRLQELRLKEAGLKQNYDLTSADRAQQNAQFRAELERSVGSENANRLMLLLQDQANRKERAGDTQWGRVNDLLGFMERQSPADEAFTATREGAALRERQGKVFQDSLEKLFQRIIPGSAGGGGGTPPVFQPPMNTPNNGQIDLGGIFGDYSTGTGYSNIAANLFGSLFKGM